VYFKKLLQRQHRIIEEVDGNGDTTFYPESKDNFFVIGWEKMSDYRVSNGPARYETYNEANEWLCEQLHYYNTQIVSEKKVHKANPVFNELQKTHSPTTDEPDETSKQSW